MEGDTTYGLSYWEGPSTFIESVRPEDNLTCSDVPMSDETTHKVRRPFYFSNDSADWNLIVFPDELFWQLVHKDRTAYNTLRQAVAG